MLEFNKKKIIIIVGNPGSGKSTLGKMLSLNEIPKIISNTSRKIRINDGEVDGVDYYFKNKEDFTDEGMLEYVEVFGEFYGITWNELYNKLTSANVVYSIMEIEGAVKLKQLLGDRADVRIVFIKVDKNMCKERMIKRGDSIQSIEEKLLHGVSESNYWEHADCIINNDGYLCDTYNELHKYVLG